jgi:hypothetical protein
MDNKFDELTKQMTQSATRRAALKKFGIGLAGMALACLGLANKAEASGNCYGKCIKNCVGYYVAQGYSKDQATTMCQGPCALECSSGW